MLPPDILIAKFFGVSTEAYVRMSEGGLVRFGRVMRPHALKGEASLKLCGFVCLHDLVNPLEFFDSYGEFYDDLESLRSGYLIKFVDCNDRDALRGFIGRELFVKKDNIKLQAPYFDSYALVGTRVLCGDVEYGVVIGYFDFGAGPIAEIAVHNYESTVLLPWSVLYDFKDGVAQMKPWEVV